MITLNGNARSLARCIRTTARLRSVLVYQGKLLPQLAHIDGSAVLMTVCSLCYIKKIICAYWKQKAIPEILSGNTRFQGFFTVNGTSAPARHPELPASLAKGGRGPRMSQPSVPLSPVLPLADRSTRSSSAINKSTSQFHRMAWVARDLKDHPVPTPLPVREAEKCSLLAWVWMEVVLVSLPPFPLLM